MDEAEKLRHLAAWYREYAEQTQNPAIWDMRLRTAEDLERAACNLETRRMRQARGNAQSRNGPPRPSPF